MRVNKRKASERQSERDREEKRRVSARERGGGEWREREVAGSLIRPLRMLQGMTAESVPVGKKNDSYSY